MTTKPRTNLAEQVRQAQQTVNTWSERKRSSLHLEGVDTYLTRKQPSVDAKLGTFSAPNRRKVTA